MWKCKECGEEVFKMNKIIAAYRIDEDMEEVEEDESLGDMEDCFHECSSCGNSTRDNRSKDLEDIAEWVDDEENE